MSNLPIIIVIVVFGGLILMSAWSLFKSNKHIKMA